MTFGALGCAPSRSCAWRARSATARCRPGSRWSCPRSIRRSACRCTRCSPTRCRWSTWRSCSGRPRRRRWRRCSSAGSRTRIWACASRRRRRRPAARYRGSGDRGLARARNPGGLARQAMAGPWRARRPWRRAPRLAAWAGMTVLFGCARSARCSAWRLVARAALALSGRPAAVLVARALAGSAGGAGRADVDDARRRLRATGIAIVLVAGCLENESRRQQRPGAGALASVCAAPGAADRLPVRGSGAVSVARARRRLAGGDLDASAVRPALRVFDLADPYRSLDPRYARTALALGKPPWLWLRIKLVMLLRPSDRHGGGFAVSVAQFLPTLFAGGGRFATLATETLAWPAAAIVESSACSATLRRCRRFRWLLPQPPGAFVTAGRCGSVTDARAAPEGVRLRVGGSDLLAGFGLDVAPGAVTTVMGPSGCGKSSLRYICGTLEPVFEASGEVWLDGVAIHELPPERRRVGILFQDDAVLSTARTWRSRCRLPCVAGASGVRASRRRWTRRIWPASVGATRPRCRAESARVALMRTLLAEPRCSSTSRSASSTAAARSLPAVRVRACARRRPAHAPGHPRGRCPAAAGAVVAFPKRSHRRCPTWWPCPASGAACERGSAADRSLPRDGQALFRWRGPMLASGRYPWHPGAARRTPVAIVTRRPSFRACASWPRA